MITVYSKPRCIQCTYTEKELDKLGLAYDLIDVTTDAEAAEVLRVEGFSSLPVVNAFGAWWSGFRPDRIRALKQSKQ